MNVQALKQTTVTPTPHVTTLKDLMFAIVVVDIREMVQTAQVNVYFFLSISERYSVPCFIAAGLIMKICQQSAMFYLISLVQPIFHLQISMNVPIPKQTNALPTLYVPTQKDLISAAALVDIRAMVETVQVNTLIIPLLRHLTIYIDKGTRYRGYYTVDKCNTVAEELDARKTEEN